MFYTSFTVIDVGIVGLSGVKGYVWEEMPKKKETEYCSGSSQQRDALRSWECPYPGRSPVIQSPRHFSRHNDVLFAEHSKRIKILSLVNSK